MDAAERKEELRRRARAGRVALGPAERVRASAAIVDAVVALPEWRAASVVAVYEPTGSEVDVTGLATAASAGGRAVLVPEVVDRSTGRMRFVSKADDAVADDAVADTAVPDLVVVPLLAFDRAGRRLGQGGGFYDRWLAGSRAVRVGVAFACQEVPEVPTGPHDQPLDVVVTEDAVLRPGSRA